MVKANLCPVCGYEMEAPPRHYRTCPSCGTEFGVHDVNATTLQLRRAWLRTGPHWWSTVDPMPDGWNPLQQLASITPAIPTSPGMATRGPVLQRRRSRGPSGQNARQ